MKRMIRLLPLALLAVAVGCGPKAQTSGNQPAAKSGKAKSGTTGAKAQPTPEVQRSVTRESSSTNPQAVASLRDAVEALEKIRKEGSGSYDEVITKLEGATALDSNFAEAWYNLGVIYEDLGKYDKAENSFSRAVRANPKLTEASASLGRIYVLRGNTAQAKSFFNDQLARDPKNKDIRNKLAEIYRLEKNYNGALEQIKAALFIDPDNVEAYKTLALVFMDQGKPDMAKMTCANALKIDPENASIYNNLGLIYLKQGDTPLAAAQFSKSLEKDAGFAPALANLGAIALDHKDYNLAAECYGKLAKIKPSNWQALNAYAVALRGLGKNEEAKDLYMKVHSLDKSNHEVSFNLGILYQRGFKDPKTALRYYQDYVAKGGVSDPNHQVYKFMKQAEDEIKAQEMMNAPEPTKTPEPAKETAPGDVAADKKEGAGAEGATPGTDKPKAEAPGKSPAANN